VLSASRFAADQVMRITGDAVQILGGHGYIQDHPVEKWMRDARALATLTANAADSLSELQRVSA
jgi:alkylation response protein AidB-like acyl-CoA dehydrogenase